MTPSGSEGRRGALEVTGKGKNRIRKGKRWGKEVKLKGSELVQGRVEQQWKKKKN